jgi:hypothetical protein
MTDRFELEQKILNCWGITDDIRIGLDIKNIHDRNKYFTGLVDVYEAKFSNAFESFEECCKNGTIK